MMQNSSATVANSVIHDASPATADETERGGDGTAGKEIISGTDHAKVPV